MFEQTLVHLRHEIANARKAEEDALAKIERLQDDLEKAKAALNEARFAQDDIRKAAMAIIKLHGAEPSLLDQDLAGMDQADASSHTEIPVNKNLAEKVETDDQGHIEVELTESGRLPRGTSKIINAIAFDYLQGRGEVPFGELATYIQSRFAHPLSPSTIRSALDKAENIDRPKYGFYSLN